jgi:copper chaperone CopZ
VSGQRLDRTPDHPRCHSRTGWLLDPEEGTDVYHRICRRNFHEQPALTNGFSAGLLGASPSAIAFAGAIVTAWLMRISVDGMGCRRCVRKVTACLRDVPGVRTVVADPHGHYVVLTGDMSEHDVEAALESLGRPER